MNENFSIISTAVASIGALGAIVSGIFAWISFNKYKAIQDIFASDETIIHSDFIRPELSNSAHRAPIITCYLFNKSKRKAFITDVKVFVNNKEIDIRWSNKIDSVGNPIECYNKFGIVDSERLYIYRNDGVELSDCEVRFTHSFSSTPVSANFLEYKEFLGSIEQESAFSNEN